MFDKKQKCCVKRIHLVTDDGLYDRKAFHTVKTVFYLFSINDCEFINYYSLFLLQQYCSYLFCHYLSCSFQTGQAL